MKALDLFCGLGGWSNGLAMEGFEVLGVEIEPKIAKLYKHPVIVADVRTLDGENFKGFDLIVGSPPCRDFTQLPDHAVHKDGTKSAWKRPKQPKEGLKNVFAFLDFVKDARPKYWLMENVPKLKDHLPWFPPNCTVRLTRGKRRCFWGNFPAFLIPRDFTHSRHNDFSSNKLRKWERARIPLPVARALGKAVKEALT